MAPFDIDVVPESEELLKTAQKQLRETPEVREEAIKELRKLLHDNEDLHFGDDDKFLTIFLRPCHWYPESALKLVSYPSPHFLYKYLSRPVMEIYLKNQTGAR